MERSDFYAYLLIASSALLATVLLILLVRIRAGLGRRTHGLPAILTEGMLIFTVQVVIIGGVLAGRVTGWLSSPQGVLVARFTILGALFLSLCVGVGRLLYWFLYDDGIGGGELDERLTLHDEIQRLSIRLGRFLDAESDKQRHGGD